MAEEKTYKVRVKNTTRFVLPGVGEIRVEAGEVAELDEADYHSAIKLGGTKVDDATAVDVAVHGAKAAYRAENAERIKNAPRGRGKLGQFLEAVSTPETVMKKAAATPGAGAAPEVK